MGVGWGGWGGGEVGVGEGTAVFSKNTVTSFSYFSQRTGFVISCKLSWGEKYEKYLKMSFAETVIQHAEH